MFALLSSVVAGTSWLVSGWRLRFLLFFTLPVRILLSVGLLIGAVRIKKECDKALDKVGTAADFKAVKAVADTGVSKGVDGEGFALFFNSFMITCMRALRYARMCVVVCTLLCAIAASLTLFLLVKHLLQPRTAVRHMPQRYVHRASLLSGVVCCGIRLGLAPRRDCSYVSLHGSCCG